MTLPNLLAYLRVKYAGFRTDERSLLTLLVGHLPVAEEAISSSFGQVFSHQNGYAVADTGHSSRSVQTEPTKREQDVLDLELQFHELKTRLGWRAGQRFLVDDALMRFRTDVAEETRRKVLEESLKKNEAEVSHANNVGMNFML